MSDAEWQPLAARLRHAAVATLRPVLSSGAFDVFLEQAPAIPLALREIGCLRELTFRAAGEGSGQ